MCVQLYFWVPECLTSLCKTSNENLQGATAALAKSGRDLLGRWVKVNAVTFFWRRLERVCRAHTITPTYTPTRLHPHTCARICTCTFTHHQKHTFTARARAHTHTNNGVNAREREGGRERERGRERKESASNM